MSKIDLAVGREAANDDAYLTPQQVADRYGGNLSVRTLANWRTSGDGPRYVKLGGKVMYLKSQLLQWEESRTVKNTSQYRRA